jgi:hypothetical protein
LLESSVGVEADGKGMRAPDGIEEEEEDESGEGASSGSSGEEEEEDGSEGDEAVDEARIQERQKDMEGIAAYLWDLASAIQYNAPYADPHALALFTRKTKSSVGLIKKIQEKEKLVRSITVTASNPPVFARAHADLIFVRTRPRNHATV